MTITYSCIANGRAVLAELALTGGCYQEAVAKVLRLVLLRAEPKTIIQMESYVYHTLFIDGITYVCATDNALDTVAPSAFLKKVSDTFTRNPLMSQEYFSPTNAVAADFQQVLGKYMPVDWKSLETVTNPTAVSHLSKQKILRAKMKYNKNQGDSTISKMRSQVTDVTNVMTQNIDMLLEREERSDVFLDRTDDLPTPAKEFQQSRKIPRRIWCKYFKKIVIISTVAILLSVIIILLSTNVIPT